MIEIKLDARTALECPEYLHKSHAHRRFDLSNRVSDDPLVAEFKRLGLVHEERVIQYLRSLPLKVAVISQDQGESVAQIHTAQALLDSSNQIILGAYIGGDCEAYLQEKLQDPSLGDESRVSRPDILIQVGVNSKGTPQWAPVDIKNHGAFDSENKSNKVKVSQWSDHLPDGAIEVSGKLEFDDGMQLAHYHAHLLNLGFASPDYLVGIVGREYQAIAWAHLDQTKQGRGANASTYISIYHDNFLKAEKVVRIAIERNRDEAIEAPVIAKMKSGKFGCSMCEFRLICMDEMEKFDNGAGHVTLLARVTAAVAEKDLPGIESIRDLVSATGLSDPGEKARRRARAWQSGKPELVDPSEPLDIPQFDIEVDIDLENSQGFLEEILDGEQFGDDQVYLYGYGVHDRVKNPDWRTTSFSHFSNFGGSAEDEYEVMLAMWQKLEQLVRDAKANDQSIGIFHYSSHEKSWWRRFAKRYSSNPKTPSIDAVEGFMNRHFVDLLEYSRKVALKSIGYSIKQLAPLAGFSWSVDSAGGALSLLKYQIASNKELTQEQRQEAIDWLIDYNRDDVKATYAVRDYLRSLDL